MKPANSDLIADILAARRQANAVILSIPATPATMRTQSAEPTDPAPQPAPTPISEADFRALLEKLMPAIIGAVKMVYETKVRPQFKGQRLILAQ